MSAQDPRPKGDEPNIGLEDGLDLTPPVDAQSAWADLQREYDSAAEDAAADDPTEYVRTWDVPASQYGLAIRYRWKDPSVQERIAKQAQKIRSLNTQAQFIAAHTLQTFCEEVVVRVAEGDGPECFTSHPGGAVGLFLRLAKALGLEVSERGDRVLELVLHVFKGNAYQMIRQANELSSWLEDPAEEVNNRFLGG